MNKIYKQVENNIEYEVFESDNYHFLNKAKTKNIPYSKYIINFADGHLVEVLYLKNNFNHNFYGPAFTRHLDTTLISSSYYIYDIKYSFENWKKLNIKLSRKEKLNNLTKVIF